MKSSKIPNQSYLRKINQNTILNLLRKERLSCADIAKKMGLSNTAIANITDELVRENILIKEEAKSQEVGRRPILLSINPDAAAVLIIDLAGRTITLTVADLSGHILNHKKICLKTKITESTLKTLAESLLNLYRHTCPYMKILALCISTPGKIDIESGYFLMAHRFENYKSINLKNIFSKYFNCEILIYNDIKLALEGERSYGDSLNNIKNALMLHIDYSVGSALILNHHIYNGTHGFAGEITNFTVDNSANCYDFFKPAHLNNLNSLSVDNLIKSIKNAMANGQDSLLNLTVQDAHEITIADIAKVYSLNDTYVKNTIDSYAKTWANIIKNITEFLDLQAIMLSGDIVKLGDGFKQILQENINKNLKYYSIKIIYSSLAENAPVMGAMNAAINAALQSLLYLI